MLATTMRLHKSRANLRPFRADHAAAHVAFLIPRTVAHWLAPNPNIVRRIMSRPRPQSRRSHTRSQQGRRGLFVPRGRRASPPLIVPYGASRRRSQSGTEPPPRQPESRSLAGPRKPIEIHRRVCVSLAVSQPDDHSPSHEAAVVRVNHGSNSARPALTIRVPVDAHAVANFRILAAHWLAPNPDKRRENRSMAFAIPPEPGNRSTNSSPTS